MTDKKQLLLWSPGIQTHEGRPSSNLGDLIIEEAVLEELRVVFTGWNINRMSTHMRLGPSQRRLIKESDLVIVGGSNLLSSYMDGYFQWDLTLANAFSARGTVLMGAGWWRDQGRPNRYTRLLLNLVLSRKYAHSVRDSQAKRLLSSAGIPKVLNTCCPTMWSLAEQDTRSIPTNKADSVLCMLTDYYPEPELDRKLLDILKNNYKQVFLWPQGSGDYRYAKQLNFDGVIIDSSLQAFEELLQSESSLDYVGTRLHGGVRCLRNNLRCLTLEVDNRAREIAKDTGLPTTERDNLEFVKSWIKESKPIELRLPVEQISAWKEQFKKIV